MGIGVLVEWIARPVPGHGKKSYQSQLRLVLEHTSFTLQHSLAPSHLDFCAQTNALGI